MLQEKMSVDEQVALLMQGTEYGDEDIKRNMTEELRQRLVDADKEGRPLRVYCGYDPVRPDLHLGHTITMRKLRQFQDLGHQVIFLIGTYTSLIGDPSDKDVLRPILTSEQVEENARTYAEQAFRVLDREKTIVHRNAEWLSKLTFADLIKLGSNFTIQQFLTRENFKLRWEKGDAVYLHETFYSLMQGYDAYALRADVQVGGTEQLFNIFVAARKIMTFMGAKPNIAILMGILPGTDGVIRMSKSLGNHIPISTTPEDMYGKVMSVPDSAMGSYFRLIVHLSNKELEALEAGLREGQVHPRDMKMRLAHDIVSIYYSKAEADAAQEAFVRVFQKGDLPEAMPEFPLQPGQTVLDVLLYSNLVSSKGEGRRLIAQNGVRLDGETLTDPNAEFPHSGVLQVGKRRYLRVTS